MKLSQTRVKKARYYSNVTGINLLALLFLWLTLNPLFIHHSQRIAFAESPNIARVVRPAVKVISGAPIRLSIPSLYIDLPVDRGEYNQASGLWTLHDLRAYYAIYSAPANNLSGNTFIYGHNNYRTLGGVKSATPGTLAYVYTDNGHVFTYSFENYTFVEPDDLSVFKYQGKPILTIQTCTGVWNETRGMFKFNFVKVE